MNTINAKLNQFLQIQDIASLRRAPDPIETSPRANNLDIGSQKLKPDIVEISAEGRRLSAATPTTTTQTTPTTQTTAPDTSIERLLTEAQGKMNELRQEVAQLQNNQDETSKRELANLNGQLVTVTNELAALQSKKQGKKQNDEQENKGQRVGIFP